MCRTAIWPDESSLSVQDNTILMCMNGMDNLLCEIRFYARVKCTVFQTDASAVLHPDFMIDDIGFPEFTQRFRFFFMNIGKQPKL